MERRSRTTGRQKSDEGAYPAHRPHGRVSRATSVVSLPVDKQLRALPEKPEKSEKSENFGKSPYQKIADYIGTLSYDKEVATNKRMGFYRLGTQLGSGNFSKVKVGCHILSMERVAIKIMEKSKMDTKSHRLLGREIESMEKMNHPNIIKLFEHIETSLRIYLVLEYASGGELYEHICKNGKMSESEAKPLYAQIVSAVAHMHSRNLVHRDIKAENIMFSNPNTVKLGDFGFSCLTAEDELLQTFCGSPPYAAPELFKDKSYSGELVDVWALGCLLYFMLVGETPFKGDTVSRLKKAILAGEYELPGYLSAFVGELIKAMLRVDAEKRADVEWVKKNFWMRDCRFTKSYLTIETNVKEQDEEEKEMVNERVWELMNEYGLDEEKVKDALEKGPRDPIIGTYRIVQYQVHREMKEAKERPIESPELTNEPSERKYAPIQKVRSKACTIS